MIQVYGVSRKGQSTDRQSPYEASLVRTDLRVLVCLICRVDERRCSWVARGNGADKWLRVAILLKHSSASHRNKAEKMACQMIPDPYSSLTSINPPFPSPFLPNLNAAKRLAMANQTPASAKSFPGQTRRPNPNT